MTRSKPRTSSPQGVRRSARLIDVINGTTGPRKRRASLQSKTEEPLNSNNGRKRSVARKKPTLDKQGNGSNGTEQKTTSRKVKDSELKVKEPKKTSSKKAKASGGMKKTKENPKPERRTRSRSVPTKKRASSPAKSSSARRSKNEAAASRSVSGKGVKNRSRSTRPSRAKGSEIREDVGEVKPGGLVSALGRRKTPWEVSNDEANKRRQRAHEHRLFLVGRRDSAQDLADDNLTYIVMGTTGNIYYTTLSPKTIRCTCVDQRVRKVFCKHILFVLLKVLKVPETHPVVNRKFAEISAEELAEIYQMSRHNQPDQGAVAPDGVRKAWQSATGQAPTLEDQSLAEPAPQREIASDDDCPICFEPLDSGEPLEYCKGSCGRSVHAECFAKWAARKKKDNEPVTCVYCRQPWIGEKTEEDRKIKRTRLNLEDYVEA